MEHRRSDGPDEQRILRPGGQRCLRVFTIGGFLSRPDRTSFYLGFREIDPINSKAVTGSVTYILSPEYALTASSTYDFGNSGALSNSVLFTRMGKDLQVTVGFNFNALTDSFGAVFEIVPNLLPANRGPARWRPSGGRPARPLTQDFRLARDR